MTPGIMGPAEWNSLTALLITLWLFAFTTTVFTVNFLLGHAIVPSLAHTGHLPSWAKRLRPLFYLVAIVAFAADVFLVRQLGNQLGIIYVIYPRSLI